MTLKPLGDRVIVKRIEAEQKTKGGLIIPETAQEKPIQGQVIAVGNGTLTPEGKVIPLNLKAGQKVLFGKWSGTEVSFQNEDLLILKESDIFAIVE